MFTDLQFNLFGRKDANAFSDNEIVHGKKQQIYIYIHNIQNFTVYKISIFKPVNYFRK